MPVPQPVPQPIPNTTSIGPRLRRVPLWAVGLGLGTIGVLAANRSRSSFLNPLTTATGLPIPTRNSPGGDTDSLTADQFRNAYLGQAQAESGSLEDQCRALARSKRKKPRKCLERANVAWTSGPKRGKVAGKKCLRYAKGK